MMTGRQNEGAQTPATDAGAPHYAFVGFGALGRQIAGLFLSQEEAAQAIFFDDLLHASGANGSQAFANHAAPGVAPGARWVIGLGYKHLALKERLVSELLQAGKDVPALVHPRAYVHPSAQIGSGVVIYPLANVDQGTVLEAGALLNNSVVVSHDTVVGSAAFLSPGVVLAGGARIGARCFLGAGSIVADGVSVGEDAMVGIGSVVTRDVPPGASVIGSPLRTLERPLRLR